MHGLINRALQSFVTTTYGDETWRVATSRAGLDADAFEAMMLYEDAQTQSVLDAICALLVRDAGDLLEDLGTFLVSHPRMESLRRLLRFGGNSFAEFLHSLDDLPGRTQLAVADLRLPALELRDDGGGAFSLTCDGGLPGYDRVMTGVLRAMADDYGALALIEHQAADPTGRAVIAISLLDTSHWAGREFQLGAAVE